jgi:predicted TIM-barrel fold metal-dependent hydrolase
MPRKTDVEEAPRLPIKLDPVSNGEFVPPPASAGVIEAQRRAHAHAAVAARRLGMSRRDFLRTNAGAATVLLALNEIGCKGGRYNVPREAATDPAAGDEALRGEELIFDVQTHHVTGERPWWESDRPNMSRFLESTPQATCGAPTWVDCYTQDPFLKEIFLDSDTHLGVLSALWGTDDINPIHAAEMELTRERMGRMDGAPRLRIHGHVQPVGQPMEATRERMQQLAERSKIDAWKLYPVWGPDGKGYRIDRGEGAEVIAHALELGPPIVAVHKGLPLGGVDEGWAEALDVGPAAKQFPKATILVYHSGIHPQHREGPYDPDNQRGVDTLIRGLADAGIGRDGNVYAELGSAWRMVMGDPDAAAHLLGKLLLHLGEDRILWGTDAIWYGSPQDQIQAFRTFEISEELQEKHGYPALTPERKRKIFGQNAVRVYGLDEAEVRRAIAWDSAARAKAIYREGPQPSHRTYGPRTRREVFALLGGH